ncbi:hypothetical protein [uncultured Dokdonia sp.]|uniref:hypothetical protein n=1 Tax=uncultured Dokdonia sp. TaxID=575653 RepID=UPI002605527B|nr:hypothetical protein [uncultured Dokdonia sp.]
MCQFDENFVLCTCSNDLSEKDIDWKLRRRIPNTSNLETWLLNNPPIELLSSIGGMMYIPDKFKTITPDVIDYHYIQLESVFDSFYENEKKLNKLRNQKKIEYKNTSFSIQLELNRKNCFDKVIPIKEMDTLTIRLDKELNVWANFMYKKSKWFVTHILSSDEDHDEISKGIVKKI